MRMSLLDAEQRLRLAMLDSDVEMLDKLLDSRLLFTNHMGQLISKHDDLAAHRSGLLRITSLSASDMHVRYSDNTAIVSAHVTIAGTYDGRQTDGDFRFTRVWLFEPVSAAWKVIAAHSTRLA
jgi:hypothetical protein